MARPEIEKKFIRTIVIKPEKSKVSDEKFGLEQVRREQKAAPSAKEIVIFKREQKIMKEVIMSSLFYENVVRARPDFAF